MYNRRRRGRGPQAIRREEHARETRVRAFSALLFAAAILVLLGTSLPIGQFASSAPLSETLPAAGEAALVVSEPFPSAPAESFPSVPAEPFPSMPAEPPPPARSVPTPPGPSLAASAPAPAEPGAPSSRPAARAPVAPASEAAGGSEAAPVATPQPTALASRLAASPSPSPGPVQSPVAACQPGESFTQLVRTLGEATLGRCLENEYVNLSTGDTHQRTTRGLLVWVKARGVPAFTDGETTWYGCADAVRERPSGQPFPC